MGSAIVVGMAVLNFGGYEAFRWTEATGMIGLGVVGGLSGNVYRRATAVTRCWDQRGDVSVDGSKVVGVARTDPMGNPTATTAVGSAGGISACGFTSEVRR